jgi:hypothetical protein
MESLALKQFQTLFCDNKKDSQLYLGYYLIGTQQEFLKRKNDAEISFLSAKNYLKESKLNNSEKKIMNLYINCNHIIQKVIK